jgi:hypothetical protein
MYGGKAVAFTKILPAVGRLPMRVKAHSGKMRVTIKYDKAVSLVDNHDNAMRELVKVANVCGLFVRGQVEPASHAAGFVYVPVDSDKPGNTVILGVDGH